MLPLAIAAVGSIAGALASRQKAPQQATFRPVNVQEEQRNVISGNLANFDSAATLASRANSTTQSEATRLMEQAMPGFSAIQQRLLGEVNKDLDSQTSMPREMTDKIAQFAAERGITRGTSGNFNAFSLVKDFGFNLVDWRNASRARALNTLSTVFGMTPRVNVMSPMASMVDPNTGIQVAAQNNSAQFNSDQAALNAQTAAGNYNRSLLGGALQSVGTMGAIMAMPAAAGVQPKATQTAQPGVRTMAPGTSPLRIGPGYATPLPRAS